MFYLTFLVQKCSTRMYCPKIFRKSLVKKNFPFQKSQISRLKVFYQNLISKNVLTKLIRIFLFKNVLTCISCQLMFFKMFKFFGQNYLFQKMFCLFIRILLQKMFYPKQCIIQKLSDRVYYNLRVQKRSILHFLSKRIYSPKMF